MPPDQVARVNLQRDREFSEQRNAGRDTRALNRPEIARADSEDVRHLFLSLAMLVPNPAQICGKNILQIHAPIDRRKGMIVLGTIVPIRYVAMRNGMFLRESKMPVMNRAPGSIAANRHTFRGDLESVDVQGLRGVEKFHHVEPPFADFIARDILLRLAKPGRNRLLAKSLVLPRADKLINHPAIAIVVNPPCHTPSHRNDVEDRGARLRLHQLDVK